MTYSVEIAVNWAGASTNLVRMRFARSMVVRKSPTPKPKLIMRLTGWVAQVYLSILLVQFPADFAAVVAPLQSLVCKR